MGISLKEFEFSSCIASKLQALVWFARSPWQSKLPGLVNAADTLAQDGRVQLPGAGPFTITVCSGRVPATFKGFSGE